MEPRMSYVGFVTVWLCASSSRGEFDPRPASVLLVDVTLSSAVFGIMFCLPSELLPLLRLCVFGNVLLAVGTLACAVP